MSLGAAEVVTDVDVAGRLVGADAVASETMRLQARVVPSTA